MTKSKEIAVDPRASVVVDDQMKIFISDVDDADGCVVALRMRFDDACGNGHNTFSVELAKLDDWGAFDEDEPVARCELAHLFPKFAHLAKWHLTSSEEPLHYMANTLYHAGERDFGGLLRGEKVQQVTRLNGCPMWRQTHDNKGDAIQHPPLVCAVSPEDGAARYEPIMQEGQGKQPDLEAARVCAVWEDATLEQLRDEEQLKERLPALMEQFRADMEDVGFTW